MAVPTDITDLSTTASSNAPLGSESIGTSMDDYLRAFQAIIKQNVSIGSNITSSGTPTIHNAGGYFLVTGTTTINGFADSWNGRIVTLKFSGALTLTDSASLILFGSDITTAAGDVITIVNESTGVYRAIAWINGSDGMVTLAATQTLTNKTIVAASNTITTAASGALAATELNAALAELQAEKVAISGDTMTGDLVVTNGASPTVSLKGNDASGNPTIFFIQATDIERGSISFNTDNNYLATALNSDSSTITSQTRLFPNGQFYLGGATYTTYVAPTGDTSIATKKYVDDAIIPATTKMVFYQSAAPTGWTQDATKNNYMLRVVSGTGGGSGGADSPILMDKVPTHTHTGTTAGSGAHTHIQGEGSAAYAGRYGQVNSGISTSGLQLTAYSGTTTTGNYVSTSADHTHTITTNANSGAGTWQPFYIDTILATKD